MNAFVHQTAYRNSFEMTPFMWGAVVLSLLFHLGVVTLGVVGLPYIKNPRILPPAPISVDIVEVSEKRTTNRPPIKAPLKKLQEKKDILPEKKEKKPPAPPKVEAKEPPKAVPPEPPKEKAETVKPKPKVPPPPSETLKEVTEKKPPPKEEKAEAQQEDQFASLLKNLQDGETQPEVEKINPEAQAPQPSPLAEFSQRMSMSEADALRRQLTRCWSIQAGARYAESLVVEIRLTVTPARQVSSATIVDQWRYGQDPHFRAAADSAMRAVRSPLCNPLDLPPDKYDLWKDIVVNFDPSEML